MKKYLLILALFLCPDIFAKQPSVIIFLTDDQGTLDVNCYGSSDLKTPNMDRIARDGVRFTQAYAHTVCCPSRAMLLTGRYPQRANVNSWTQRDPHDPVKGINMFREETTIAEMLKTAGYKTALVGKWHLGSHFDHGPLEQGFDLFYGHRGGFIDNYVHYHLHSEGLHDLWDGKKEITERGKYYPDLMTEKALNFIESNKENPFFLYLAYNIPHYPEQADPRFDEVYKDLPEPRRSYAKIVSTTDDYIGRILKKLDDSGLTEETIIIFMSDNGHSVEDYQIKMDNHKSGLPKGYNYGPNGGGGNTGKWIGNKSKFLEGGIRVPAMISFPAKLPKGIERDQVITGMDWFPTIAELCGVKMTGNKVDGHSLMPIINQNSGSEYKNLYYQWKNDWMVREGQWKLIGKKDKPAQLLNLNDELPERKNYLKEHPEIVSSLLNKHTIWSAEVTPQK